MSNKKKSALLVIDVQNDFCSGGTIEVPNSLNIIPIINRIRDKFDIVIFSKDWHPSDHMSFECNGGKWNTHCVQDTDGANLHPGLDVDKDRDFIVHKGTNAEYDAYSAFYDSKEIGKKSTLYKILENNNIGGFYVCGIAAEYGVYSTLLDGVKDRNSGYKCYLIEDATIGFDDEKIKKCFHQLQRLGVRIINSDMLMN